MYIFGDFADCSAYIINKETDLVVDTFYFDAISGEHWTHSGKDISHYNLEY